MNKLYDQIVKYQKIVEELNEEFDMKEFYSEKLMEQIQKSEGQIKQMIGSLEQERLNKSQRQYVLKHKISPHPHRIPIQLQIINSKLVPTPENKQIFFKELLTQNCRIQLQIKPIKIHPVYRSKPTEMEANHKIPKCSFQLILFHGNNLSQLGNFSYDSQFNIHPTHISNGKLGVFNIIYQLTGSTHQVLSQIIREHKIYIFLQSQFRMITAMFQSDFSTIIQDKLTSINDNLIKNLIFYQIGTDAQMFSLQCSVCLKKSIISPQLFQLKQKMHAKRVVSKSPTRNRSPSPKLHRTTAQSLLKRNDNVVRATIVQNNAIKLLIYKKLHKNDKFRYESPKIEYSQHIAKYQLQSVQQNQFIYLNTKIDIQNGKKQGFMELKMDSILIKITIKLNRLFKLISLSESRKLFKTAEDCKNMNAVIKLTQNIYIRPDDDIKVIQSLSQYKIGRNSIVSHSFKSNLNGTLLFYAQPADLKSVQVKQKQTSLRFTVDSVWVQKCDQLQVVIAAKSDSISELPSQALAKQMKIRGADKKLILANQLTSHKICKSLIQLHILNYKIIGQEIDINLQLEVDKVGFYKLDTKSSLPTKGKIQIKSSNQTILRVVTRQFDAQQFNSILDVQLIHQIDIKAWVILYVHNLTDNTCILINVQLNDMSYYEKYKRTV